MVSCDKSSVAPASLVTEKAKGSNGNYRGSDVIEQLKSDFHDKCYICELEGLQDPQIEHLIPHKGNIDLKFDWGNLFWSCGHCNSIKNNKIYEGKIINCCQEDPEQHIACRYADNDVQIEALDQSEVSLMTASLIYNVFNLKNTGMRTNNSAVRLKALQEEMNIFFNELHRYKDNKSPANTRRVVARLRKSTAFAAFKRSYIRNNSDYAELQAYVAL
ncbi:hypothetical protein [Megasphaera sp.]|uniref:hypothetical protein n=1 Tax=Megasphaera sp. TaxID=2023260 RepID=UPI0025B80507|nr:hypothetical protein [Megasphaera sp.]MBS5214152.1 hypothetical protein [Megasphaera sp.]